MCLSFQYTSARCYPYSSDICYFLRICNINMLFLSLPILRRRKHFFFCKVSGTFKNKPPFFLHDFCADNRFEYQLSIKYFAVLFQVSTAKTKSQHQLQPIAVIYQYMYIVLFGCFNKCFAEFNTKFFC